jgi:kinesin family protein 2/24
MLSLIKKAQLSRTTHSTVSNEVSSRSHAICQIVVKRGEKEIGKLMLVDLAGSERAQDT